MSQILPLIATLAMTIGAVGMILKLTRYGLLRLLMKRELKPRSETPFPIKPRSLLESLWMINVSSYSRFWLRANPITFTGHVLYHAGLFVGIGTYAIVSLLAWRTLLVVPLGQKLFLVCDWFNNKEQIFGTVGYLPLFGELMEWAFIVALVIAVIGMAIPFLMSALKLRGMIRPLDPVMKEAGIRFTNGLSNQGSLRYSRKAVGLGVLLMDGAMLASFLRVMPLETAYLIHVSFGMTLIALLPFSFLFHEIYRLRMWGGALRLREGRTA